MFLSQTHFQHPFSFNTMIYFIIFPSWKVQFGKVELKPDRTDVSISQRSTPHRLWLPICGSSCSIGFGIKSNNVNNVNHVQVLFFFFWKSYLRTERAIMIKFSLEGNRSNYFFLYAAAMYWLGINLGNSTQLSSFCLSFCGPLSLAASIKTFLGKERLSHSLQEKVNCPWHMEPPPRFQMALSLSHQYTGNGLMCKYCHFFIVPTLVS